MKGKNPSARLRFPRFSFIEDFRGVPSVVLYPILLLPLLSPFLVSHRKAPPTLFSSHGHLKQSVCLFAGFLRRPHCDAPHYATTPSINTLVVVFGFIL